MVVCSNWITFADEYNCDACATWLLKAKDWHHCGCFSRLWQKKSLNFQGQMLWSYFESLSGRVFRSHAQVLRLIAVLQQDMTEVDGYLAW